MAWKTAKIWKWKKNGHRNGKRPQAGQGQKWQKKNGPKMENSLKNPVLANFFAIFTPVYLSPDVFPRFCGKQKNPPPGKSPRKTSKIYTTKIPDTLLQRGRAKNSHLRNPCFRSSHLWSFWSVLNGVSADGVGVRFPICASKLQSFALGIYRRIGEKRRKTKKREETRRITKKSEEKRSKKGKSLRPHLHQPH